MYDKKNLDESEMRKYIGDEEREFFKKNHIKNTTTIDSYVHNKIPLFIEFDEYASKCKDIHKLGSEIINELSENFGNNFSLEVRIGGKDKEIVGAVNNYYKYLKKNEK